MRSKGIRIPNWNRKGTKPARLHQPLDMIDSNWTIRVAGPSHYGHSSVNVVKQQIALNKKLS
jgi:hypothetical protein